MKHYLPEELEIKSDSKEEQIRTRQIFLDLKTKALEGKKLYEREKYFLCLMLKISLIESDGKPEDFKFCEDFIFKELYLVYFTPNNSGQFKKVKGTKLILVSENEKIRDFKKLNIFYNEWKRKIEKRNHTDQLLQKLATETRKDLKELDKKYPKIKRIFNKQKKEYLSQKRKIILHSKFIYLLTKSVMEDYNQDEFKIPFSGQTVEFTTYSLIHILNRHYSEHIKKNPNKTYHYDHFYPKELHIDLKNILIEIDSLKLINLNNTVSILFEYKKIIYQIWIQKRIKQIKGKGNVKFYRIESFYPIYDKNRLMDIKKNYKKINVNKNLNLFLQ